MCIRMLWTGSLAMGVVCAAAFAAGDLTSEVDEALGIVTARVAAIEGQTGVPKSEKKERRQLRKAGKGLERYTGDDTKRSLKKAALAVKRIASSGSSSSDVQGCIDDLLDALTDVANGARNDALDYTWPAEKSSRCRRKYDNALASGDGLMVRASERRYSNPGKSASLTVRATDAYWKAGKQAERCAEQTPAAVYVYSSRLFNDLDRDVQVHDIVFYLSGALGGKPLDYVGRGSGITPGTFPFTVPAGTSRDLAPLVLGMILADPALPAWQMGDFVISDFLIETSEGDVQ